MHDCSRQRASIELIHEALYPTMLLLVCSRALRRVAVDRVSHAEHTTESLADVKRQVEQGRAVLVDVREPSEWNAGHVQGAIALPLSTVSDGLSAAELAKLPRDKVLYTYCVVGKRALTVGTSLEQQGLKVKVLKPGYKELIAAGFPAAGD